MRLRRPSPPWVFLRFFRWFCHPRLIDHVEGDLMELYDERFKKSGKLKANLKFILDVLLLFRPGIIRPSQRHKSLNPYAMYKSYFKIALRTLWSNKGFSFINISGLSIGMTTCVLIMLYVLDEMSYDRHHQDGDRIFRIASSVKDEKWVAAPAPLAEGLKKDFAEVEETTRLLRFPGAEKMLLKDEQSKKQFFETNAYYVDSTFFRIFNYDLKYGDLRTALQEPNSIVISEAVATKFFGNENPVNNVLKVGLAFGDFNYTIKGVIRNTRNRSHIPANLLLSMNNGDVGGWVNTQTNWASNSIFHTYVKLKAGTSSQFFESKLNDFLNRNGGDDFKAAGFTKELFIQPVEDIYLHSDHGYEVAPNGNIKYLYIFTSIAAFLLLIACINFMNLSTARSEKRAREVGLRKAVGSGKSALVSQFLSESLLMSGLALALSFVLIQLLLPIFNQLTNKELSLLQVPNVYTWLIGLTVATGLISGMYPAFYLSSFMPATVLKGKLRNTVAAVTIRKGLVVFQFTISIVLILGAMVTGLQMKYLSNQRLGFDKNQKIILPLQTNASRANGKTLANELLSNADVVGAAIGGAYPGIESVTSMLFHGEGKAIHENADIRTMYAETGYIETLGIELLRGRGFADEFTNDLDALVLNEAAINQLGYTVDNAVGKKVYYEFQNATHAMNIIGVVKDYHFQSLHQKIKPLALTCAPFFSGPGAYLILDVKSRDYSELLTTLQKTWNKINPDAPFAYSFLDEDFQKNYAKEERTSRFVQYFTLVAIVIACMGLFGLATFTAEQRIKEIGVRKVLGASVPQIVTLLSKDFLKLVMVSIVLSSPIAYYGMNQWLQGFAYRIDLQWWVFGMAGITAVLIALFTVSFQAIKAAIANPVNSLKSE
jgi:putative ABC transport system permease protein